MNILIYLALYSLIAFLIAELIISDIKYMMVDIRILGTIAFLLMIMLYGVFNIPFFTLVINFIEGLLLMVFIRIISIKFITIKDQEEHKLFLESLEKRIEENSDIPVDNSKKWFGFIPFLFAGYTFYLLLNDVYVNQNNMFKLVCNYYSEYVIGFILISLVFKVLQFLHSKKKQKVMIYTLGMGDIWSGGIIAIIVGTIGLLDIIFTASWIASVFLLVKKIIENHKRRSLNGGT